MADLPRFLVRRCSKQSEPGLTFHKEGQRRGTQIRAEKEPGDLNIPLPFEADTPCDICVGSGWLICDFCRGEKVNIQVKKKMYRRCPSCRAAGVLMCPRCKVLRCVTFPAGSDGALQS